MDLLFKIHGNTEGCFKIGKGRGLVQILPTGTDFWTVSTSSILEVPLIFLKGMPIQVQVTFNLLLKLLNTRKNILIFKISISFKNELKMKRKVMMLS